MGTQYRRWDAQADTFAMSEYNAGHAADEIAKQLIRQGYAVTRVEVVGSLYRQGIQYVRLGPMPQPAHKSTWNALADEFALAGFEAHKKVSEIFADLTLNGYDITETEIRGSLIKQGKSPYY